MQARLCATVTGRTTRELRAARDGVVDADMVELRLDFADELDVAGVLADRRCPVVVTCRPTWEGGRFAGSEEERLEILRRAADLGAEYVDVEWRATHDSLVAARDGRGVVISMHDFGTVPDDLEAVHRQMRGTGAEVVKIAVAVDRLSQLCELERLGRTDGAGRHVIVGMGGAGVITRLLPDRFGSAWTYAGAAVAPGQVGLRSLREDYDLRRVDGDAELYGVLGKPLAHSLSPAMHNAGFREAGQHALYVPLEAADIEDFEHFARAFDVRGASVTAPYKEVVMDRVSSTDALGERVGAINTLRRAGGGWEGRNTDVPGFLAPLTERGELDGVRASVLGAGGAARAVAVGLADQGADVTVCARRVERAEAVAGLVAGRAATWPPASGSWDLLVNTTPTGTYPAVGDTPMDGAPLDGRVVYDLVYNPTVTRLLADGRQAGCDTIGGLDMLVAQAEQQFAWWTGASPAAGTFRRAAERALARAANDREDAS